MDFFSYCRHDFPAGLVVFLVALPLCLGIALASGAPLFAGIISGVVGGVVVGFLSRSQLSISGPAAGLTTIVLAGISDLTFPIFLNAVIIAGLIQIIAAFLNAGSMGHFFPASVLKGMLSGIGVILILKQIPHAVGYDADFEGDMSFFQNDGRNTFTELMDAWEFFTPGAIVVGIISILIMTLWNHPSIKRYRFFRFIPAALAVVITGILLNDLFALISADLMISEKHLVSLPVLSEQKSILSFLTFPDFSQISNPKVWIAGVTIAAVASIETLLNIEACDKLDPLRRTTPLNSELKAQGFGNALAGFLGGLPVTSVVVRSSANVMAGGRTKASAITHGVILLLSVIGIPYLLQRIPLSALAGILIVMGWKLSRPMIFREMYQKGWAQFLPFAATVVAIVFTNLLLGVFIGILVAVFFILKTNFQEAVIMVNEGNQFLLKFTKDVSFLNKSTLRNSFHRIPAKANVTIDGTQSHFIDYDIKEMIRDFIETSKAKNIQVHLKQIEL
jgi:MFS superfamily sulfate permease-like transporter